MNVKVKILILTFTFYLKCEGQNLVPNYSFENYTTCGSSLFYANPWFQPSTYFGNVTNSSSTDLFNTCMGSSLFSCGVPLNVVGYQQPKTGNGYAGFGAYVDTVNSREYLEVELTTSLIFGQQYCLEMYLSLSDSSNIAISNISVYFSIDSVLDSTYGAIDYIIPQIENGTWNMLNNKTNWMKIFGTYTAQGGEKFITIGNFNNPNSTNYTFIGGSLMFTNRSYYYIDDVSVIACDTTLTSVDENNKNDYNFSLYPNPSTGNFSIKYDLKQSNDAIFKLYDIRGKLLNETVLKNENTSFDFSDVLANGIYFYEVTINGNIRMSDKLIIIK